MGRSNLLNYLLGRLDKKELQRILSSVGAYTSGNHPELRDRVRDLIRRGEVDPDAVTRFFDAEFLYDAADRYKIALQQNRKQQEAAFKAAILSDLDVAQSDDDDLDDVDAELKIIVDEVSSTKRRQKKYSVAQLVNELTTRNASERLTLVAVEELADVLEGAGFGMDPDLGEMTASPGIDAEVMLSLPAAAPPSVPPPPPPPSALPSSSGNVLFVLKDRYRVLRKLGEGGFGVAYEATDNIEPYLGSIVIKLQVKDRTGSDESVRREATKARKLHHKNVCKILNVDVDPTHGFFLVIEHGGRSLADILHNEGSLPIPRALSLLRQAADALDYCHREDLLHLDIKPENILVDARGTLRLCDFGVSAALQTAPATRLGQTRLATSFVGLTLPYAAPEVVLHKRARPASDQYSLARVFSEMVGGAEALDEEYPPSLSSLTQAQNEALARALALEHGLRFRSCSEFIDAMEATS